MRPEPGMLSGLSLGVTVDRYPSGPQNPSSLGDLESGTIIGTFLQARQVESAILPDTFKASVVRISLAGIRVDPIPSRVVLRVCCRKTVAVGLSE
jgi:hypothetical protein